MENFKIDPGAYFPTANDSQLISPIIQDYENNGAFIQSQEDFAKSISMPGDSITELMAKVEQYTAMTENILAQTPNVPFFGPGTQVDLSRSMNKLAQAINPEQASLRAAARPQVLGTADDLARYAQSGDFQTFGYVPSLGSEQEYRYGRAMTWGDTMGKALAGGGALAWDTFIEGWKGWGRMAEALFTWDASKLYGSPEERYEIAKQQEDIFNKYAIYNTAESEDTLLNRQFFGNMLQQTGFTVGAIGQMVAETYLTGGIAKAISMAAGGLGKARTLTTAMNVGELVNDTRKVQQVISNSQRVNNAINNIARSVVPLLGTTQDLIKAGKAGAGMLQLGMIGAGGIKRELSMFNMARSEAIFEAASTYKDLEDRLVADFVQRNGRQPNESELNVIRNTADNASSDNFYVNTGILTLMNRIQFGNMFKSFNTTRKIFNEGLSSFGDDVFEVSGKVGEKTVRKVYEKGFFGSLGATRDIAATFGKKKAAWETTKSLGRGLMKFEGSEGAQELLQEASNKGLSEYYYDLYHGKKGYGNKIDAVLSNIQNPITELEGTKTFLMGALTGRFIAPFSYGVKKLALGKDAKELKSKKEEAINIINTFYADPTQYIKEQIANVKVQNRAAETMEEAAKNQDRYTFHNAKDSAFAKAVASAIKLNLYDSLKDTLVEFGQQMSEEEFTKAFGIDASAPNRKGVNEFIGKVVSQMDDYYTVYNNLKDKYGDRIVPELYKYNSPEEYEQVKLAKFAQDQAIEMLATNVFRSRQATKRAVELTSEMAANPNIGSSATEMITKLGSEQAINSTIEALQKEVKTMEAAEALTPEQRELLKQKKEELRLAEAWKTNYESIMAADDENYTHAIQERAYKAFQDIINHYNKVAKKNTAVTREDIDDNFLRMVDYLLLNRDSKSFIDAMNLLADPYNMNLIKNVIAESSSKAGKNFQTEHYNEVASIGKEEVKENKPPIIQPPARSNTSLVIDEKASYSYKGSVYNIVLIGDDVMLLSVKSANEDNNVIISKKEFENGLANGTIVLVSPPVNPALEKTSTINYPDDLETFLQQEYNSVVTALKAQGQSYPSYEVWKKTVGPSATRRWNKAKGKQESVVEQSALPVQGNQTIQPLTTNAAKQIETAILGNMEIKSVVDRIKDAKEIVAAFDWALKNFPEALIKEFTKGDLNARDQLLSQVRSFIKQNSSASSDIEAKKADIKRRRQETIDSIKEGYNGGKTWNYTGQFSSQVTKLTDYELFQDEYTKDQVIDKINAKYDAELAVELAKELQFGKSITDFTPAEQAILNKYSIQSLQGGVEQNDPNDVKDFVQDINQFRKDSYKNNKLANAEYQEGYRQIAPFNSLANTTDLVNVVEFAPNQVRYERGDVNSKYEFSVATSLFMPGYQITFRVLTDNLEPIVNRLTGEKYDKNKLFDKNLNALESKYDFIPIGVFAKINGKDVQIGTVHEPQWIEYKIGDKYPHIAIPDDQMHKGVPKVVVEQVEKNRELRKLILDKYNQNHNFVIQGVVEDKSIGMLRTTESVDIISKRVNPRIAEGGTDNRHGMFAILRDGGLQSDRNLFIDNVIPTESFSSENMVNYQGIAVLMLPTPTGQWFPSFIKLPNVSVEQSEFIIEAWKAFTKQTNNPEIIAAVYDAMGLVQSPEDFGIGILRDYINHYITQLDGNSISRTGNGIDLRPGSARLNITNKGGLELQVKDENDQWYTTEEPIMKAEDLPVDYLAKMSNLKTTVRFSSLKNENLKGINSTEKATILTIKNGKLVKEKVLYNQYIMDRASTFVDKGVPSMNEFNDWVYFANPVVKMAVTNFTEPDDNKAADSKTVAQPTIEQVNKPREDKGAALLAALKAKKLQTEQVEEQKKNCNGLRSKLDNIM